MTDFAYIPNEGPPRIIRFAPPDFMSGPWVAVFHKASNLLVINEDIYRALSREEQVEMFKTRQPYTYLDNA